MCPCCNTCSLQRVGCGKSQSSFDKQYVRDWLTAHWDKESGTKPPRLPEDVIKRTSEKYIEAYEKITGEKFPFA